MGSKRIHGFEFEDQSWFPSFLRNYVTDFLQFLANKAKVYEPVVELIEESLQKSGEERILDLGSGSGGGLLWLGSELKKRNPKLEITLTDLYPNATTYTHTDIFEYYPQPVDAREVPKSLTGFRTMFLSFHHFRPKDARRILSDAVKNHQSIGIFEIQDRGMGSIVAMLLSPISVLLATPFIRPFRLGRIIFTYLIPIVPLVVLWDGVVSALRTYSEEEMKKLIYLIENQKDFEWVVGRKKSKTGFVLYTIGIPKQKN
jgi:hypothetical protein